MTGPAPDAESRCSTCANENGQHELWCPESPQTLTMGELRELLTKAIELDGVNETKPVALLYRAGMSDGSREMRAKPLLASGAQFFRGQFVFLLREVTSP